MCVCCVLCACACAGTHVQSCRWIVSGSTDGTAKIWATPVDGALNDDGNDDNGHAATGGHDGPLRVLAGR